MLIYKYFESIIHLDKFRWLHEMPVPVYVFKTSNAGEYSTEDFL